MDGAVNLHHIVVVTGMVIDNYDDGSQILLQILEILLVLGGCLVTVNTIMKHTKLKIMHLHDINDT